MKTLDCDIFFIKYLCSGYGLDPTTLPMERRN